MGGAIVGTIATALGAGAINRGVERTKQYDATRAAQGQYDVAEESFTSQIDSLRKELAPFLNGEALPKDIEATGRAAEESQKRLGRAFGRAGITGGEGLKSLPAQAFTQAEADINAQLASTVANRQFESKKTLAQAEAQKAAGLAPYDQAVNTNLEALRSSDFDPNISVLDNLGKQAQFVAPTAVPAALATGVNAFAPGTLDVGDVVKRAAVGQVGGAFGTDANVFGAGEGKPFEVNDQTYTEGTDTLGRKVYNKVGTKKPKPDAGIPKFDENIAYAKASGNTPKLKNAIAAKKSYIEARNLVGEKMTIGGRLKTYQGNGAWK